MSPGLNDPVDRGVDSAQILLSRGYIFALNVGKLGPGDAGNLTNRIPRDSSGHSLCSDVRCSHRIFSKNFLQEEYRRSTGVSI